VTTKEMGRPRTVLEYVLQQRDQTHEEVSADFERTAAVLGISATLSPRHLRRLASGQRTSAGPHTRRVMQELLGIPFAVLMEKWREDAEQENSGIALASALGRDEATKAIQRTFVRMEPSPGTTALMNNLQESLSHEVLSAWQVRQQRFTTRPHFVIIGGYAGSGKTEFGRFLSSITGWALLDKDALTRPLVEHLLVAFGSEANDRETPVYRSNVRPFEYQCLMNAAYENLECGISTIVAAPFADELNDERWLQRLLNRCGSLGTTVSVTWVTCDADSMYEYLSARGAARDAWKLANWPQWLEAIDLHSRPACNYFHVDNRLNGAVSLADQARSLVKRMYR
jgi:predicted kinase